MGSSCPAYHNFMVYTLLVSLCLHERWLGYHVHTVLGDLSLPRIDSKSCFVTSPQFTVPIIWVALPTFLTATQILLTFPCQQDVPKKPIPMATSVLPHLIDHFLSHSKSSMIQMFVSPPKFTLKFKFQCEQYWDLLQVIIRSWSFCFHECLMTRLSSEDTVTQHYLGGREQSPPNSKLASALLSDFLTSRTTRNNFCCLQIS